MYKILSSGHLVCYMDSDWAGEYVKRRSTSGMLIFRGDHLLRASSTLQAVVALSSAEAEYNAAKSIHVRHTQLLS